MAEELKPLLAELREDIISRATGMGQYMRPMSRIQVKHVIQGIDAILARAEPERHVLGVGTPHWTGESTVGCTAVKLRHPDGAVVYLRWPGSENCPRKWRLVLEKEE